MQSSVTFGFLLLCALAPPVTSVRIRSRSRAPDPYEHCEKELSKRAAELIDRLTAYDQQCGVGQLRHVTSDDKVRKYGRRYVVTEDARELLCKESCRSLEEFATDAPDSTDLIRECRRYSNSLQGFVWMNTIFMTDAFDEARKACEVEEVERSSPLLDNVEQDLEVDPEIEIIDSPKAKPDIVNDDVGPNVVDLPVESPVKEPEIVDVAVTSPKKEPDVKPVVEPVVLPGNSPVAPLKGNKIKQMTFEYELKDVLALRSDPTCAKLKKVFKVCDYKRTGKVYFAQIDNMLDKLDSEKVESMKLLKEIYEKAKKDPDTQPMTFKDWTFFKMGLKEATSCALEYATQS